MTGDEGFLTLTVMMRVSPEPNIVKLLKQYRDALNYSVEWIVKNSTKNGKRYRFPSLSTVHRNLYETLKDVFGLPSRIAIDCYREALAMAKSYLGNGANGRIPKVRTLRMWLTHGQGYRIRDCCVEITGRFKLKVIGWDRRYDGYESTEARLIYRDGKMFLMITKRTPKPKPIEPRDVISVDVNEAKIAYGNMNKVIFEETAIDRAYRYVASAQKLQEKYSSTRYQAWLRRRGILKRVRSYRRKAGNILIDWAKKTSYKTVRYALEQESAIALEDLTNLMESIRNLPKNHRTKLVIMGYRRLLYWIEWQAKKRGVPVIVVDPRGTSSTCPKCEARLVENGYRKLKCLKCGFEGDRDVTAVLNIERKAKMGGSLITPTAPQMTDVNPNRCGEPMSRPEGALALQSGEEVSASSVQADYKNSSSYKNRMKLMNCLEWEL